MFASGIFLIIRTESHLTEAACMCDNAKEFHKVEDDLMKAWAFGSCYKGKVYPFVPIDDYLLPNGNKLFCDCKYAVIPYFIDEGSAVGFINKMRSLR